MTKTSLYNPLVSIIINCYNGDKFLKQALNSVVYQTYKNWELIFWDVSSNNLSKTIVKSFKNKKFRYFNTGKKKNLYHSRNEAIKKAKGDILAFLDADDWWVKDKLKNQIKYFTEPTVGLVYSNYFSYYEKNKKIKKINLKKIYSGFIQQNILDDYRIGILTTLIRKKLFYQLGGYNKNFHICGDFEFNIRLSKANKIIGLKEPLAYYRIHENNISKNLGIEINELKLALKIFKKTLNSSSSLKKYKNYINYKIFYFNYIKQKNILILLKKFIKLDLNFLKLKALIILLLPKFILNKM